MTDSQEGYVKARDKLRDIRFNMPAGIVELELFRGQVVPVSMPKGIVVRVFDYDVLDMGGDDQVVRRGKHARIPTTCQVKTWEGPVI